MLTFSEEEVKKMFEYSIDTEEQWIEFYDNGMSIVEMRKAFPEIVYGNNWYDKENFGHATAQPQMRKIKLRLENSASKKYADQVDAMPPGHSVASAREVFMCCIIQHLATGKKPLHQTWARTSDRDSNGYRVRVGGFDSRGLRADLMIEGRRDADVGLAITGEKK